MPKPIAQQNYALQTVAENMMRPVARYFDENEHEIPWDYINFMHQAMRATGAGSLAPKAPKANGNEKVKRPPIGYQSLAFTLDSLASHTTAVSLDLWHHTLALGLPHVRSCSLSGYLEKITRVE